WRPDNEGMVDQLAKETAREIDREEIPREEDADQKKRLRQHVTKTESRAGRENMVALARSELAAAPDAFDKDPWLLNCENGTINLRTSKLRPHRREDMLTKMIPTAFVPNAKCPLWDSFLNRVMDGNADLIRYLQRLAGYALTGMTSEHVLVFSYGEG